MNRKKLFFIGGGVVLVALVGIGALTRREKGSPVQVSTVGKENLQAKVSANGKVQAVKKVDISANVMGRVTRLAVKEGDVVKAGQFLLEIDPSRFQASTQGLQAGVEAAESDLASNQTRFNQAKSDFARAEANRKAGIISQAEFEQTRTAMSTAQSSVQSSQRRVDQAKAGVREARVGLNYATIKSPMDGVVTARRIEVGETAVMGVQNSQGTVLITVSDMSKVEAEMEVDEASIPNVKQGQTASVHIDAYPGQTFQGEVTEVGGSPMLSLSQNEAIKLIRLYAKDSGEELEEAKTFDEAFANADTAMKNGQPADAVIQLERAIVLQKEEKDPERLQFVQYQLALAKYLSEDVAGSVLDADKFAREFPKSKLGPPAAVLAINGSLFLCSSATAADRPAAEKQLNSIVKFTLDTWPNRAEADDARIALGSLKMANRDPEGAIAAYDKVNPASERAAKSQSLAAKAHRLIYAMARQANKLDDAAKAHQTQSRTQFEQALAAASKSSKPEDELVVSECRLNLAEMHLEAGEVDAAIAMLTPLETKIRELNPESLDNAQLRTLLSAIRGHSVKKNLAGALACGLLLLEKTTESPQVNSALVSVSRLMRDDYKADQGKLLELANMESPDQATVLAANIKADASKAALVNILNKLAPREQLNLPEMVALGDFAADAGLQDLAQSMYQRALEAGQALTTKTPQTVAALTRVQAALIGLLRAGGQFPAALVQVDALIAANPKALDPKIERARILQGMADTDPSKWKEAATAWSELRNLYQRAPKKPAAYYDMVYNIGLCLAGEARTANNQKTAAEKKNQAKQLLKGTLALAPELNGPEMVAKFNDLLEELSKL